MPKHLSPAAAVWRAAMDYPYQVRATVYGTHSKTRNKVVGSYATEDEAREVAAGHEDSSIIHRVSLEEIPVTP